MGYRVELADAAREQLAALDREWQSRLAKFLDSLEALEDPAARFERLHNKLSGLWKHREGHVRMIALAAHILLARCPRLGRVSSCVAAQIHLTYGFVHAVNVGSRKLF